MQEEFSAKLTGRFVDDDDIVRTGRAMLEIDGFNMLHLPIPDGYKEQIDGIFASATGEAEAAKKYAAAAGGSATSANKSAAAASSSAKDAKSAADGVVASAAEAKASASGAASSASGAASSAAEAKKSATAAQGSATASQKSAEASKADAGRSASSSQSAASSASKAASSASDANKSAEESAASARNASVSAERAATIASSTSWDGDKLTVNGQTSPSLTGPKGDKGEPGQDGSVVFEELTEEQKDLLRGPAGVVISETEPADKNVVWIQPGGEKFEVLGNSHTVMTDAEAEAVSEFLPKGFYIYVISSDRRYEVV